MGEKDDLVAEVLVSSARAEGMPIRQKEEKGKEREKKLLRYINFYLAQATRKKRPKSRLPICW